LWGAAVPSAKKSQEPNLRSVGRKSVKTKEKRFFDRGSGVLGETGKGCIGDDRRLGEGEKNRLGLKTVGGQSV